MYRLGLVDTLVTHANTNGVWPNFLVWSPWLYASSVKNKTKNTSYSRSFVEIKMSIDLGHKKTSALNQVHFGYWHSALISVSFEVLPPFLLFTLFVYIVCLHFASVDLTPNSYYCWDDENLQFYQYSFSQKGLLPWHTFAFYNQNVNLDFISK